MIPDTRAFARFNAGINRARIEYARTLAELQAPRPRHALCGTLAGRRRHYRDGTPVCDDCRNAYNERARERRAERKGKA